eukprot:TRINITY_DN22091_c0_g1_i1.p1 TRINITY_DN22091_c0_g1~~TRINITY_DN22091_c0_g1_i1.p1  ORF type:complete len:260 (-),score=102.25 TRINITY_DN22091_c0_g1_i1:173-883(-)
MAKKGTGETAAKKNVPASTRTLRSKGDAAPIKAGGKKGDLASEEAERFLTNKASKATKAKPSTADSPKKRKAPAKRAASPSKKEAPAKKPKRQGTMAVTADEGAKFVEKQGGVSSDEEEAETKADAKADSPKSPKKAAPKGKKASSPAKPKRQGTMAVTAQEGEKVVEKLGGVEGKLRSDDKDENEEDGDSENAMKRAGTMAVTADEGAKFVEKQEKRDKKKKAEEKKKDKAAAKK